MSGAQRGRVGSLRSIALDVSSVCTSVLLMAAVVWLVGWVVHEAFAVVVPLSIALFATALLQPLQHRLTKLGIGRTVATFIVLLAALGVLAAVAWFVVPNFTTQLTDLRDALRDALENVKSWLHDGPLSLAVGQVDRLQGGVVQALPPGPGTAGMASAAISGAKLAFALLAGVAFAIFLTFFFIRDGRSLWQWIVDHAPTRWRGRLDCGGSAAWGTLTSYLRGVVVVAAFNAAGTGVVLVLLDVPLVYSLVIIEFVLSFVPFIGALTAGALAALVTLASNGVSHALIVVAAAVAIEQIEGHVLQPVVIGHAVDLHPVVVAAVVALGAVFFGIVGALLAVPVAAALASAVPAAVAEPPTARGAGKDA